MKIMLWQLYWDYIETEAVIKDNNLTDIFIANYNTNNQQVISGPITSLQKVEEIFYDNYALKYVKG